MEFKTLLEIFELAGYKARSYTGRGMRGSCLGVDCCSNMSELILDTIEAACENNVDVLSLVSKLRGASSDSMGRRIIVYWPSISWEDEDEDEDG